MSRSHYRHYDRKLSLRVLELESRVNPSGEFSFGGAIGSTFLDRAEVVDFDADGNSYVAGRFRGTVDFDPGAGILSVSAEGPSDNLYIAKYGTNGWPSWVKTIRSVAPTGALITPHDLKVDGLGQVSIIGTFFSTALDFDPGPGVFNIASQGTNNGFFVRLNSAGNFVTAKSFGTATGSMTPRSLAIDSAGNIAIAGSFQGTVDFDPGPGVFNLATQSTLAEGFVVRLNSSANFAWAKHFSTTIESVNTAVALDKGGNVFVGGHYRGLIDFDPGNGVALRNNTAGTDAYLVKLNSAGALNWFSVAAANNTNSLAQIADLAVDSQQNILAGGYFKGSVNFAATSNFAKNVSSFSNSEDSFVWRVDGFGRNTSNYLIQGNTNNRATALELDSNDNIYMAGIFAGTADFDPSFGGTQNRTSLGGNDGYVVKLSPRGDFGWVRLAQSTSNVILNDIAVSTKGYVTTVGDFANNLSLAGAKNLTSAGSNDGFFWQVTQPYLHGFSYGDVNSNGLFDVGETPIANVAVDLYENASGKLVRSTITDAAGKFKFVGLETSPFYRAEFRAPVGNPPRLMTITNPIVGGKTNPTQARLFDLDIQAGVGGTKPYFGWATNIPGENAFAAGSVVGPDGSVYTVGSFTGTVDFDHGPGEAKFTAQGINDVFVMKHTADGAFAWVRRAGGTGSDAATAVAIDKQGHIIVTGRQTATASFFGKSSTNNLAVITGNTGMFLWKLDGEGETVTVRGASSKGGIFPNSITTDNDGNVIVGGSFDGASATFSTPFNFTVTNKGSLDGFIWKLDSQLNGQWVRQLGGLSSESVNGVAVDPAGNVYATGYFTNRVDFDPSVSVFNLISKGGTDAFAWKLNSAGNFQYAKSAGGTSGDLGVRIAADAQGNAYIVGSFSSTNADFDPGPAFFNLSAVNNSFDTFVWKLFPTGNLAFAKAIGGKGSDTPADIMLDAQGRPVIVGNFQQTVDFDPGTGVNNLTSRGDTDGYLLRLSTTGNFEFARGTGSVLGDSYRSVFVDPQTGSFTLSGYQGLTTDYDPGAAEYNLTGIGLFVQQIRNVTPVTPTITGFTPDSGTVGDFLTNSASITLKGTTPVGGSPITIFDGNTQLGITISKADGSWTFVTPFLANGLRNLKAQTPGTFTNSGFATLNVTIDTVPPTGVISGISDDTGFSKTDGVTSDQTLIFNGTSEAFAKIEMFRDGVSIGTTTANNKGAWSFDYTSVVLNHGSYRFSAKAADAAGNVSPEFGKYPPEIIISNQPTGFIVFVDTKAPGAPTIFGISEDTGVSDSDQITADNTLIFTGLSSPGALFEVFQDGVLVGTTINKSDGSFLFDYRDTVLADGTYNFTFRATDPANNVGIMSPNYPVTIDRSVPFVMVDGISNDTGVNTKDAITSDQTLVINGSATAGQLVSIYLDGNLIGTTTANASNLWSFDYTSVTLPAAKYQVSAKITVASVDYSSQNFPVVVDLSAPTVTITATETKSLSPALQGTVTDPNSTIRVTVDGVEYQADNTADGKWSLAAGVITPLIPGTYDVVVSATDLAGNIALDKTNNELVILPAPEAKVTIAGINADTGSNPNDGITSDTTLILSGTATPDTTVEVLINGERIGDTTANNVGLWSFDYTGTELPQGEHVLTAAITFEGDLVQTDPFNLRIDSFAPVVELNAVRSAISQPGITGTIDDFSAEIQVIVNGLTVNAKNNGDGTWNVTPGAFQLSQGTYEVRVKTLDLAGNSGDTTFSEGIVITGEPSVAITGINEDTGSSDSDGITSANSLIYRGTSEPNAFVQLFRGTELVGTYEASDEGLWEVDDTLTPLAEGTYTLTAKADALGKSVTSLPFQLVIDRTAPTITVNTVTTSSGQPTLSGTVNDPSAEVTILLNGQTFTAVNTGTGQWTLSGSSLPVLAVGTYSITASATDQAGNTGTDDTSNELTIRSETTSPPVVPPLGKSRDLRLGTPEFAVGQDRGGSELRFYGPDRSLLFTSSPFGSFTGGLRTATADFNRDGVADIVVGTGPGRATQVQIIDGKTQQLLFSINPFEASFVGGVYVATGDITGDGIPEVVITPDEGGGPRARVFDGKSFNQIADFFGIEDPNFRGGARATIGDLTGDGKAELLIAAGFGGGPRISVWDGSSLTEGKFTRKPMPDFFAFEPALRNGSFLTIGDITGDGLADLVFGGGPGGAPRVRIFDGAKLLLSGGFGNVDQVAEQAQIANFFAGDVNSRGGVRLAVKDLDNDDFADLVVGAGEGDGNRVIGYLGKTISSSSEEFSLNTASGFSGGVFVG